jgi:hypothetical protein
MSGIVEDVNDDNYESFIQAPAAVVAYGIAACEPCKAYDPILTETARQYSDVRFGKAKMHVPGRCRIIKRRHQFETYPTTHFFSHGTLLSSREGKLQAADLAVLIKQYFSNQT